MALLRLAEEFDVEPEWLLDEGAAGEPEPRRVRRGRFTMADRAWLIAGAAAVLYLIAYSAVILSDPEGLAVQILQMGGTYRVIMSVQYVNLVLAGPWMRFALAHTAAALFCRYAVTPEPRVQLWLRRASWLFLLIYALMLALSIVLRVAEYTPGGALHMLYNYLVGNSGYMLAAGALFGLSRRRPPV